MKIVIYYIWWKYFTRHERRIRYKRTGKSTLYYIINIAQSRETLRSRGKGQFTVNNIQNASVHEGNGHFKGGVPGEGTGHAKAFQMQIQHSSWKGTTPEWKATVKNSFDLVKKGKL